MLIIILLYQKININLVKIEFCFIKKKKIIKIFKETIIQIECILQK